MRVAVVGAGIMGSGIAQAAGMAGHAVTLNDTGPSELKRGLDAIDHSLNRFVRSDRMSTDEAANVRNRITATANAAEAVEGAEVVVEAVPENLQLKHVVLKLVAETAPATALLATNTSQLSITAIAAVLGDAAPRFIGMHFFNPPALMQLVELVRGRTTSDETLQRAAGFARSMGKQVVVCKVDSAGFITTRAYAALRLECLRILEEGVASAEDIDKALKLGFNFPMGPLELGDFNGLDTFLEVARALEDAHGERFRPTEGLRVMVAQGKLGRKSGEGFYKYDQSGRVEEKPPRDENAT
jgi:3-hydroxybutyryl-CoA dehydrogenase